MVFQDINHPNFAVSDKSTSPSRIIDRIFSFVIDYLVLSPFVMFALYFCFNNGFAFAKNNPLAPENDLFYALMGLCFVLLFALLQVLFVRVWLATPGQYFLKLRFAFDETDSLSMVRLYFRQVLFWMSFLALGIPFLSVMTNKRRRTFYDQVADVSVVTEKTEVKFMPFEQEFRYWRALVGTLTVFVVFMATSFIWSHYKQVVTRTESFTQLQDQKFFCEELGDIDYSKRLETAVALNLVNQLSDACLDREADFVLWKQKYDSYSMAYYAKSLTTDETEKEQKYLAQACESDKTATGQEPSLGCKIAKAFESENFEELYSKLPGASLLGAVLKYELAVQLHKSEDISENFAQLAQFNEIKGVRKYELTEMLAEVGKETESSRAPASVPDSQIEAYTKIKPEAPGQQTEIKVDQARRQKMLELLEDL
jgi:uncharacterized RDD family membrane protein YckC